MTHGQPLTFTASPMVADRLGALGRTEDVVFSPDQTRLAVAGYKADRILVIEIKIVVENGAMVVQSDRCVELCCPDFRNPHGLAWIDDDTLAIGSRGNGVVILSVPAASHAGEVVNLAPLLSLPKGSDGLIKSPGSIAVTRLTDRYLDLLVCNNYRHNVSRHIIQKDNGFQVVASLRLFEHDLRIPDSIAVSAGGDLVAVSNHERQRVDVFSNDAGSALRARPLFSLKVTDYPHGVRFGMDDRLILVADAGAPHVHVFARGKDGWSDAASPPVSIRVMDDDAFQRGRRNPQEGGPKGVDILSDGSLFVVSCEEVPIAFFDFRSCRDQLLGHDIAGPRPSRLPEAQVLDVAIATMKGQHEQILALRSEIAGLAKRHQARKDNPGRKLLSLVKRATLKALGSPGKG